jgi:hypothetical protein
LGSLGREPTLMRSEQGKALRRAATKTMRRAVAPNAVLALTKKSRGSSS